MKNVKSYMFYTFYTNSEKKQTQNVVFKGIFEELEIMLKDVEKGNVSYRNLRKYILMTP